MGSEPLVQLSDYRWPSGSGDPIAILAVRLETIARRFGLSSEEWEEEGLGPARGFMCRLASGPVISLVELAHRAKTAYPGPNLSVDSHELEEVGVARLLEDALEALGLGEADVVWKAA